MSDGRKVAVSLVWRLERRVDVSPYRKYASVDEDSSGTLVSFEGISANVTGFIRVRRAVSSL